MRNWLVHRSALVVVLLLLAAACATTAPSSTSRPDETSSAPGTAMGGIASSSSSTSTTEPTTTTTFVAPEPDPTLVLLDRTVGRPGLVFVDRAGAPVLTVPLDRRTPVALAVIDDHRGGIVVVNDPPPVSANSMVWFPARDDEARILAGPDASVGEQYAWAQPSVVGDSDTAGVLYGANTYRDYPDPSAELGILEQNFELRRQPLAGGAAQIILTADAKTAATKEGSTTTGRVPIDFGLAGDLLVVLWSDESCALLEFRRGSDTVELPTNPYPEGTPCDGSAPTQVRISQDGRYLVMVFHPPGRVAVYDLVEGGEVGRFDRPIDRVFFDGNRTLAADLIGQDSQVAGWMIATIQPDGLDVTILAIQPDADLIGVLASPPDLPAGTTLASDTSLPACSGSGAEALVAQTGLPAAVVTTRNAIAAAARLCDVFALAQLGDDLQWQSGTAVCDEPASFSTAEADPVPIWYQTERDDHGAAVLIAALNTQPELVDGVYWWRGERHDVGIATDGTWVRYAWKPVVPPCETIWCTC